LFEGEEILTANEIVTEENKIWDDGENYGEIEKGLCKASSINTRS
jgi:hypothetical protein